jgi:2-polyprenyl-3-methyl-5-hydroxy-6-metoxy-1,4-benzoquinol methylase
MQIHNAPILGGTAPRHAWRTAQKLASFALSYIGSSQSASGNRRYLDVGCGNGFITELVATGFDEVVGIDVEEMRLEDFCAHAGDRPNWKILSMSAAKMAFPGEFFAFITSFEVLEHVEELDATAREIVRVCQRGGVIVVSVPQVCFPFENHGVRIANRIYARKVPLLPYVRPLHRKWSLARVFSSSEMDRLFIPKGTELLATSYAAPQFERAAAQTDSWEASFAFLRPILDRCEKIPVLRALTGVSLLKAYRKLS